MDDATSGSGHARCGAATRACPCRNPAGHGTPHPGAGSCSLHTGSTPNGVIHAARVLQARAEDEARAELARLGESGMIADPLRKLAELAGEADALKRLFAARVDELAELAPPGGPGTWLAAYERAFDRAAQLCAVLGKLGVDRLEAEARAAEVGDWAARVVGAMLARHGLPVPRNSELGAEVAEVARSTPLRYG